VIRRALAVAAAVAAASAWPSAAGAQAVVDLVGRITPSVAYVLAMGPDGKPESSGTAFLVGPATLVTALHVVDEANRVTVQLPGQPAADADVVGIDTVHDVAVLRATGLPASGPSPLALGTSGAVQLGEPVTVVGYPLSAPEHPSVTVTQGIVSAIRTDPDAVQIDAAINPGASGGPVVGPDGRVIGVVDASLRGAQNFNFAVPIDAVKALIARAAGAAALPLPLTTPTQIVLKGSGGGLGPYEHDEKEGAMCLPPPPHAAALTGVRVDLQVAKPMHLLAWLSYDRGLPPESGGAFGKIDDSVNPQLVTPLTGLYLPPRTMCLNYLAVNGTSSRARGTFTVTYTVEYRVFTPSSSRSAPQGRPDAAQSAWRPVGLR
jgi:S1-C subfamily serine protease